MPVTYLNTSTLSAALNTTDNAFNVAATTNISVGDLLAFRNEVMHVRDIPVSGRVVVRRGYEGTRALAHLSGATFYIGSPADFAAIRNNALGIFNPGPPLPDICIPGVRGVDVNGYEYVLVDLTATINPDVTVLISHLGDFTASVLTSTARGSIGITCEGGTSDQWVWAQIAGLHEGARLVGGSSLATTLGELAGASSVSSPAAGLLGRSSSQRSSNADGMIHGMWIAGAVTTNSTSPSSLNEFKVNVWLQYPWQDPFTS